MICKTLNKKRGNFQDTWHILENCHLWVMKYEKWLFLPITFDQLVRKSYNKSGDTKSIMLNPILAGISLTFWNLPSIAISFEQLDRSAEKLVGVIENMSWRYQKLNTVPPVSKCKFLCTNKNSGQQYRLILFLPILIVSFLLFHHFDFPTYWS